MDGCTYFGINIASTAGPCPGSKTGNCIYWIPTGEQKKRLDRMLDEHGWPFRHVWFVQTKNWEEGAPLRMHNPEPEVESESEVEGASQGVRVARSPRTLDDVYAGTAKSTLMLKHAMGLQTKAFDTMSAEVESLRREMQSQRELLQVLVYLAERNERTRAAVSLKYEFPPETSGPTRPHLAKLLHWCDESTQALLRVSAGANDFTPTQPERVVEPESDCSSTSTPV